MFLRGNLVEIVDFFGWVWYGDGREWKKIDEGKMEIFRGR
jgi:hypothetical protein